MSKLLRSMLVLGVAGLLVVACAKEEEAAPVEAPVVVTPEAAPAAVAPVAEPAATGGGYEPTAEERVPGITLDPAAPAAEAAPAAK